MTVRIRVLHDAIFYPKLIQTLSSSEFDHEFCEPYKLKQMMRIFFYNCRAISFSYEGFMATCRNYFPGASFDSLVECFSSLTHLQASFSCLAHLTARTQLELTLHNFKTVIQIPLYSKLSPIFGLDDCLITTILLKS
jgi:hypothetical protein